MKRLSCELCGSNDLVKENGLFVCQYCGVKYTVEDMKKMMVEGTVVIDTTKEQENLTTMLEVALAAKNYDEIYVNSSKLLEKNPDKWEGWYYKALSAGYKTNKDEYKFDESVALFKKAFDVANGDTSAITTIRKAVIEVIKYSSSFYEELLMERPIDKAIDSNINAFLKDAYLFLEFARKNSILSYAQTYELENSLFEDIFNAYVNAKELSDNKFGKERKDRTDDKYDCWLDEMYYIVNTMAILISVFPILPECVEPWLKFLQSTIKNVTHLCSYEQQNGEWVESLKPTKDFIKNRNNVWEKLNSARNEYIERGKERVDLFKKGRFEEYWAEHQEDKADLLAKKDELEKKLKPYEKAIAELDGAIGKQQALLKKEPEVNEQIIKLQKETTDLRRQIKQCSIFDVKNRKALKEELNKQEQQLNAQLHFELTKMNNYNKTIQSKIDELEKNKKGLIDGCKPIKDEIKKILKELTKER